MKTIDDLFNRLHRLMPSYIKPKFQNGEELIAWNQEQGRLHSELIARENRSMKIQRILSCSGIRELYINCSFDNYRVEKEGQRKALELAKLYAEQFDQSIASFIFSGRPGTGKNHLAAAIGNHLILHGKSVLIMTVADLMSIIKGSFSNDERTEENLLHNFSTVNLLVIDEIGIQTESRYEKVIINQIVDRRSSSKLPTGMLTNLDHSNMTKLLGERVMDRMCLGQSLWVNFNWESYRKRVIGNKC